MLEQQVSTSDDKSGQEERSETLLNELGESLVAKDSVKAAAVITALPNVNYRRKKDQCTALHLTLNYPSALALSKALIHKSDVTLADKDGFTPLHVASVMVGADARLFRNLLDRGAKLSTVTKQEDTPVSLAVNAVNVPALVVFADIGANINLKRALPKMVTSDQASQDPVKMIQNLKPMLAMLDSIETVQVFVLQLYGQTKEPQMQNFLKTLPIAEIQEMQEYRQKGGRICCDQLCLFSQIKQFASSRSKLEMDKAFEQDPLNSLILQYLPRVLVELCIGYLNEFAFFAQPKAIFEYFSVKYYQPALIQPQPAQASISNLGVVASCCYEESYVDSVNTKDREEEKSCSPQK